MIVNRTTAKALTDDYINYNHLQSVNCPHFDIGGERIKGYVFTRGELNDPLSVSNFKHLFLMLALSPIPMTNPEEKYLNLIIGAGILDAGNVLKNTIDTNHLQITSKAVFTGNTPFVHVSLNAALIGDMESAKDMANTVSFFNSPYPITSDVYKPCHEDFLNNGKTAHLWDKARKNKIKGFHIDDQDLLDLGLSSNPPQGSKLTDEFVFMPVIRPNRLTSTPFDQPYLSIAIAKIENGKLTGKIIEYCLPCPNHCPTNFPLQ